MKLVQQSSGVIRQEIVRPRFRSMITAKRIILSFLDLEYALLVKYRYITSCPDTARMRLKKQKE